MKWKKMGGVGPKFSHFDHLVSVTLFCFGNKVLNVHDLFALRCNSANLPTVGSIKVLIFLCFLFLLHFNLFCAQNELLCNHSYISVYSLSPCCDFNRVTLRHFSCIFTLQVSTLLSLFIPLAAEPTSIAAPAVAAKPSGDAVAADAAVLISSEHLAAVAVAAARRRFITIKRCNIIYSICSNFQLFA